jgi:putative selenate reductase
MSLTDAFRQAVGADVPISFSAGIDQHNFPMGVACGFVPVTVSSDLLRPGGYGRLPSYLNRLADEMKACGAKDVDALVLRRWDRESEARRQAREQLGPSATDGEIATAAVRHAGVLNTTLAAAEAVGDERYRASRNGKTPRRIDSHLVVFDCVTCDKCLPVCPNAANFTYPTPLTAFDYHDIEVGADGAVVVGSTRRFEITKEMQIACYADFCNECGNCDTFCPEYGGPYIEKPSFFGSRASWEAAAPGDGFIVESAGGGATITGRIKGVVYEFEREDDANGGDVRFGDDVATVTLRRDDHSVVSAKLIQPINGTHRLDMWAYHTMRHLLAGVLDRSRMNQVNASVFVQ